MDTTAARNRHSSGKRIIMPERQDDGDKTILGGNRRVSTTEHLVRSAKGLEGDWSNIFLLTFLYVLQGIPIGLGASVPMILQNRNVSYKQQAVFSFVFWPFSLKLLWAPFVDSCYSARMGRRKTWLVPTQYLLGFFMLYLSGFVDTLLGGNDGTPPNVLALTVAFFVLDFLAATQDIAVDGWALTMLSRRNVGYASTCNCVGQTAGYFLGNVVFLALESAEFCNRYLRSVSSTEGLVTLPSFLYFWGWVFMLTTTLVWMLKKEDPRTVVENPEPDLGVVETYSVLWRIVKMPNMQLFALILLTVKIGFAAADAVTGLKLIEAGVPKDKIAMMAVPMVPLQIILPLVISKYTAGPQPMSVFLRAMPYRLLFGLVAAALVWWTPTMHLGHGEFPLTYYLVLLFSYAFHQITLYSMFVAVMAFNARVSDPDIGGTYMTLLNTLSNLGGNWPSTLALWLVDFLTFKTCGEVPNPSPCNPEDGGCKKFVVSCVTDVDGFYIESLACVIIGFLWLRWGRQKILNLQRLAVEDWKVS